MRAMLAICLFVSIFMVSGCATPVTETEVPPEMVAPSDDFALASEQEPADDRERACMLRAAQTLNELFYYGVAGKPMVENPLPSESDLETPILNEEEQQKAFAEAHSALFGSALEVEFSVDTDRHIIMASAILAETNPLAASKLGINYARLFDYYVNCYLEVTNAYKDEPVVYSAELEDYSVVFTEAYEALAAYEEGDIGRIYDTYDFTSELNNPDNTLNVSGYKPAGAKGQLTWQ